MEQITEEKETVTEDIQEYGEKRQGNKKKIIIAASAAVALYLGGALYFANHFFPFTTINNVNCAFLTTEAAEKKISDTIKDYVYTVDTIDGKEQIKGSDIDLEYEKIDGIEDIKVKQNPFMWLFDIKNRSVKADVSIKYDEDKLFHALEWLDCSVKSREILKVVPSKIAYSDGIYKAEGYEAEQVFDFGALFSKVRLDVYELKNSVSLEKDSFYTSVNESPTVKNVLDKMNLMVSADITYNNGTQTYSVNKDLISQWISIGDDYTVYLDNPKMEEYVKTLADGFDTVGKERNFVTSAGETITVKGGNYGWKINRKAETAELADLIMTGQHSTREPVYAQTAAARGDKCDIYNTYVEISLASQQLWFYKNGELIINTPIVTGNPYAGNATPPGIYYVVYKAKNVVLRGADYESPVTYWMPFNGGIGLHDATWRGIFGGSIYRGGGSHGCVNLPFSAAAKIYEHISAGDPVVLY